jgi:hypothetical protein
MAKPLQFEDSHDTRKVAFSSKAEFPNKKARGKEIALDP